MKLRILALGLALTMSLPAALGAEEATLFPNVNDAYPGYADVSSENWFLDAVETCYLTGLMNGKGDGMFFDPDGTVSVAEAVAVAARVGAVLRNETLPPSPDGSWYGGAAAYLQGLPGVGELVTGNLEQVHATRGVFFQYLSIAMPEDALTPINAVTALPDSHDPAVLRFYNAGILSGVDEYGTFAGERTLTRAEMAAMVARIARPEQALTFTLKAPQAPQTGDIASITEIAESTVAITGTHLGTGEVYSITWGDYMSHFMEVGRELLAQCQQQDYPFAWDSLIGETSFADYASNLAGNLAIQTLWENASPPAGNSSEVWKAMHILVETKAEADDLRAQLKAAGDDQALFASLMAEFSTDPGSKSQPDGYVFGPGEMVAPFEEGTKALAEGEISDPVASDFGFHIILRLPLSEEEVQTAQYSAWRNSCSFSYTSDVSLTAATQYFDLTVQD